MNLLDKAALGKKIEALRTSLGLSQTALATRLEKTPAAVSSWEKGKTYPETPVVAALAELFKMTMDDLVRRPTEELRGEDPFPSAVGAVVADAFRPVSAGLSEADRRKIQKHFRQQAEWIAAGKAPPPEPSASKQPRRPRPSRGTAVKRAGTKAARAAIP